MSSWSCSSSGFFSQATKCWGVKFALWECVFKGTALFSTPTTITGRPSWKQWIPHPFLSLDSGRYKNLLHGHVTEIVFCLHVLLPQMSTNCYSNKNVCCSPEPHIQQSVSLCPLNKACSPLSHMHSRALLLISGFTWASPRHLIQQWCPTGEVD